MASACKSNPKKFWQFVKHRSKSGSNIGDLKWVDLDGTARITETDVNRAAALENYFSSVCTVEGEDDFERPALKCMEMKKLLLLLKMSVRCLTKLKSINLQLFDKVKVKL